MIMTEAYNNPLFSHHNHDHNRRVELILESLMLNVGELRHGIYDQTTGEKRTDSIYHWIDSSLLYAYWHDVDQLLTLQRNLMEKRSEETKLPPKKGHALAAAVMMLALHQRFRYERKVDTHRAWEMCAGAAAMIMVHESPERLTARLVARELAYRINEQGQRELLSGKKLFDAYNNDRLDIFSLAPSQLMELLREEKKEGGFIKEEDQKSYGLHPFFEEEYAEELNDLADNNDPLIRKMTDSLRSSFDLAAEATVRADVIDMIAPPVESILRTIHTERKVPRPFLRKDENIEKFLQSILSGGGELPEEEDSDVRRILWEYVHVEHISADTMIAKNRYVKDLSRENSIMGLLALYDIGRQIIQDEYAVFDHIYDQRIRMLGGKILRRAFGAVRSTLFQLAHKNTTDYQDKVIKELRKNNKTDLINQYFEKVGQLQEEKGKIISILRSKRPEDGYTEANLSFFEGSVNGILKAVCERYGLVVKDVRDKKLAGYRLRLKKGLYPSSIPYDTWDSIGKWPPATLVASIGEITLQQVHELYQKLIESTTPATQCVLG